MLSKNNWQEQFRKQEPKKQRFTIKKLTVGVASVLIGFTFMAGASASADQVQQGSQESVNPETKPTEQSAITAGSSVALTTSVASQDNSSAEQMNASANATSNVAAENSQQATKPASQATSADAQTQKSAATETKTPAQSATAAEVQSAQPGKAAVKDAAIETEKKNLAAPTISSVQEKYAALEAKLQNGELTGEAAQDAANALKAEIEKLSAADQAKLVMMVSTVEGSNGDNADLSGIKVPKSEWPKYASKYDTLNMQTDVLDKNSSSKSLAFKIVSRIWGGNIADQGNMQLRIQLDDRLVPYVSGIKVSTQGATDHPSVLVSQKSMEKVADSDNTWSIKLIKLHGGIMGQANVDIPYTNPKCEIEFNSSIKDFFGNLKDIKENPLKYAIYGINGEDNPTVIGNYQSTGYIFSTDNAPYGTIPVATDDYANKPARLEKRLTTKVQQ